MAQVVEIRQVGQNDASQFKHIHLADSQRILPGYGHTDFKAGFAALQEICFEGYMALECGVPGPVELPKCSAFLRSQMPDCDCGCGCGCKE